MSDLHAILPFAATARQREAVEAVIRLGTQRAAAEELGIAERNVSHLLARARAAAARRGVAPQFDVQEGAPEGYMLQGTSTLYKTDAETGERRQLLQWHKTQVDRERQFELMREAVEGLFDDLPARPTIWAGTSDGDDYVQDQCFLIPVGDFHLGMLAWKKETGGDWDMGIAEHMLCSAVAHLVGHAGRCETGVLALLGDFFHYDGYKPVTPTHANLLDSDTRYPKMVRAGLRISCYMIECMLERMGRVHVIPEIGNHDESSMIFLMEALRVLYKDNPRVSVDDSPARCHYYQFGKVMLATTHGDGVTMANFPQVAATDRPEMWGATRFRYGHVGHHHKKEKKVTVDEAMDGVGMAVERHRILAPEDAYAANKGYRSMRTIQGVTYHREFGEISRLTVNPLMFEKEKG